MRARTTAMRVGLRVPFHLRGGSASGLRGVSRTARMRDACSRWCAVAVASLRVMSVAFTSVALLPSLRSRAWSRKASRPQPANPTRAIRKFASSATEELAPHRLRGARARVVKTLRRRLVVRAPERVPLPQSRRLPRVPTPVSTVQSPALPALPALGVFTKEHRRLHVAVMLPRSHAAAGVEPGRSKLRRNAVKSRFLSSRGRAGEGCMGLSGTGERRFCGASGRCVRGHAPYLPVGPFLRRFPAILRPVA